MEVMWELERVVHKGHCVLVSATMAEAFLLIVFDF